MADKWIAESTDQGWCPTLDLGGVMLSLPIWFSTEEECRAFLATIPAGAQNDGSACQ